MPLTEKHLVATAPGLRSPDASVRRDAFTELVRAQLAHQVTYLRGENPSLHEHVLQEAVEDAFNLVWREIESGNSEWIEKWTWPYFQGVAKNKGRDAFRKFASAKRKFGQHQSKEPESHEEDVAIYGDVLPDRDSGERKNLHLGIINKTIEELPEQQRRIATILLQYPESRLSRAELIDLYAKEHGTTISDAAVKGALAVVRKKLNEARVRAGKKG